MDVLVKIGLTLMAFGVGVGGGYLLLGVLGAFLPVAPSNCLPGRQLRFAIAIPAHNEEAVIGRTVRTLLQMSYPMDLFDVFVVADHCTDDTAAQAQLAGGRVFERQDGVRGSKGAALRWLFERIFSSENYDALIVFDADTQVNEKFLYWMNLRLIHGAAIVQGNHIIINPQDGWFPALTWAMFLVDNRFQNWGRAAIGFSAKNMGDAICFRSDVIRQLGWGEGLTEDFAFRQQLLLHGWKIEYEPRAMAYGQAALSWKMAFRQRARWLQGVEQTNRQQRWTLIWQGIRRRNAMIFEAGLQGLMPSYSTLTLMALTGLCLSVWEIGGVSGEVFAWGGVVLALFLYPLLGLMLEKAPAKAYLAILTGPVFILWRTGVKLLLRLGIYRPTWIRTPHH